LAPWRSCGRWTALGPLMDGLLISLHMTMQEIFLFAAMPSILATIACYMLSRMYTARIGKEVERTVAPV
jgi:hypothetical protein